MKSFKYFVFAILIVAFSSPKVVSAMNGDESREVFTRFVHSYFENDPDTFYEICSKFREPIFKSSDDVRKWMDERVSVKETYFKVDGIIVYGLAQITSEKLQKIDFRFDGNEESEMQVIIITAFVDRVIKFDDTVPEPQRVVNQVAILKVYVTIVNQRLNGFKSDEINFGYSFAGDEKK